MHKDDMDALIAQVAEADRIRLALWVEFIEEAKEIVRCDYEKKYEAYSWCTLSENPCFRDTGDCDEYNDYLKEYFNE